jgi:cytoskeleton protein RodZ
MNNTNPPNSEPVNKPPERLHDTAGMMLRKAREGANLTHAAVGEALHLTVHYIKALENDDHGKLPGATFVKGYLRSYARYLKLDVNAVLASYEKNTVSAEELSSRTESLSRSQRRHDQTFRWAMVTAVIIVAGVAAGWWFVGKDQVSTREVTTTGQLPVELQASPVTDVATASPVASQTAVVQTGIIPAPEYAPTPANLSDAAIARVPQETAAASSSTTQSQTLESTQPPGSNTSLVPATETTAVIATTVTDSASMPVVNSAPGSNIQATGNTTAISEAPTSAAAAGLIPSNQTASVSMDAPTITATPDQDNIALTVTPAANGARQVTLISAGADIIQLYFKGSSWVEIDDGIKGRLYNETLNVGDAMTLHGTAPFTVLLGDAAQVELTYNSMPINLASQIRRDKTARFSLGSGAASSTNTATSGVNP